MGYIGSDPRNKDSVSTSQLVDDAVTNAKLLDDVLFSSVTSSIVSASGNITADTFTGTFNGALSSSAQIATSISGSSTSLSSSLSTRATTLESASGSFASDLVTLKGSGTAQGVGTSDSPTFADATITGTLTAQEIHTEFESASVIFTSGSTQFGNSLDDNHVFSGSLLVTGSLVQLRGDSTKLRFSNDAGAERAFLQLNGTGLNIDTDSFIDFKPNNTFAARFDSNGRLGIGINSPSFTDGNGIHLADDFRIGFGDGANSRPDFQIGTENGTYLGIRAGEGSDTDDLAISTSGRLGIGTTSPSSLLHVSESSGTVAHIYGGSSPTLLFEAGAGDPNFIFKQGGSNRFLLGYEDGDAGFRFYDYESSTTMLFLKNGNVGIGTTSPGSPLTVFRDGTGQVAQFGCVTVADNANIYLRCNGIFEFTMPGSGQMRFSPGGSEALTLNASQNAEFKGNLTIPEYIYHSGDTDTSIRFTDNTINLISGNSTTMQLINGSGIITHGGTRATLTTTKAVSSGANVITFTVTVSNTTNWQPINFLVQANYTTTNLGAQGYHYGWGHTYHNSTAGLAGTSTGQGGASSNVTVAVGNHSSNSFDITVTTATTSGNIDMVATLDIRAKHGISNIVAA